MTPEEMRNVGFPWSTDYVKRTFASTGGTVAATHAVLGGGRRMAANAAGDHTPNLNRQAAAECVGRYGTSEGPEPLCVREWLDAIAVCGERIDCCTKARSVLSCRPPHSSSVFYLPALPSLSAVFTRPVLLLPFLETLRTTTTTPAGGTHHAFRARGEGFCTFNDIAVAAAIALSRYQLDSILVIDLDVHQGNGTAALFEDEQRVVTFDMHGDGNYPWRSRMRNTHDVALPDGTGDEQYMAILEEWMPRLLKQYRCGARVGGGVGRAAGGGWGLGVHKPEGV